MRGRDRLPAVVWDMGGILYRFFTEALVETGRARGWPLDRLPLGPTGPAHDPYYEAMDRGGLPESEYVREVVAALAREGIAYDPHRKASFGGAPRLETWAAVDRLRSAGHRQVVLTNDATRWHGDRWWETWEYRDRFDAIVDAHSLGVRKPAPEAYLACVEALATTPGRCIFVDDLRVNCAGAEAVGMGSCWFDITDPEGSLERLLGRVGLGERDRRTKPCEREES